MASQKRLFGTTRCPPSGRCGFTIAELLIALFITSLIGACIAIMITSVAQGTAGQQDGRRHLVRLQALQARLTVTFHSAVCVLAAGNGYAVYWADDTNNDRAVQLTELGMVEIDAASHELRQYQTVFPAGWTAAQINSANTTYPANTNWYAAAQTAKATYFTPTALAKNAQSFSASVNTADATEATVINTVFSLSDGQVARAGMVGVGIRNPMAPQ